MKKTMILKTMILIALLCLFIDNGLNAQIPELINYQGLLSGENGTPLADGNYNIILSIYNSPTGGSVLWSETQSVLLRSGVFNVILGKTTPINLKFDSQYWLGVTIEGDEELSPRIELTAVPYSFTAQSVPDNSIVLKKINTDDASKGDIIKFDGDSLRWSKDLVGGSGSFALPYKEEVNFPEDAFWIIQKGAGTVGRFDITNPGGAGYAVHATSNAALSAGFFKNENLLETGANAIYGLSEGLAPTARFVNSGDGGSSALFEITNKDNQSNAIEAIYHGFDGAAVYGYTDQPQALASNFVVENGDVTSAAVRAEQKGIGSGIWSEHTGLGGSAIVAFNENKDNENASLKVWNESEKGNAVYIFKDVKGGASVALIKSKNAADHVLEVRDEKGAAISAVLIQQDEYSIHPALEVKGPTSKYKYLASFEQQDAGDGIFINMVDTLNGRRGLLINQNGRGMGIDIVTDRIKENLEISGTDASLRVTTNTIQNVPVAYFRSTKTNYQGTALLIDQVGTGKGIDINMNNQAGTSGGVVINNSGKGKGIEIYMNNQASTSAGIRVVSGSTFGSAGVFKATNNNYLTPVLYTLSEGAGTAIYARSNKSNAILVENLDASNSAPAVFIEDSGTEVALAVEVAGTGNAALFNGGDVTVSNGNLQVTYGNLTVIGDADIRGSLSKGSGSFKIDHPLDPENKFLYHSFVESPDMKNIYDGVVELDENGEAVVVMPDWFEALNRDFRYQLTCIGGYSPVYISEEVSGNKFKIAGGKPGLKVSWNITGIRKDPYANANRLKVEVDKAPNEVGLYLYPEAYGKNPSQGIGYKSDFSVNK